MPSSSDFSVESLQASAFFPAGIPFVSSKAVGAVLKHFAHLFDGELQVLPIPDDVPPSVPRVILAGGNNRRRFHAGPSRVDCIMATPDDVPASVSELESIAKKYINELQLVPIRLGLVVTRACPIEDPAKTLIAAFCNATSQSAEGPFSRSATFEIRNHKQYQPPGLDYNVNSWVRCTCRKHGSNENAVVVVQDINTLPTDDRKFDDEMISRFFGAAHVAADEILARYFPGST